MSDPAKNELYAVVDDSGQVTGKTVSSPPERGVQLDAPNAIDLTAPAHIAAVKEIADGGSGPKPVTTKTVSAK